MSKEKLARMYEEIVNGIGITTIGDRCVIDKLTLYMNDQSIPNRFYGEQGEDSTHISSYELLKKAVARGWKVTTVGFLQTTITGAYTLIAVVAKLE